MTVNYKESYFAVEKASSPWQECHANSKHRRHQFQHYTQKTCNHCHITNNKSNANTNKLTFADTCAYSITVCNKPVQPTFTKLNCLFKLLSFYFMLIICII